MTGATGVTAVQRGAAGEAASSAAGGHGATTVHHDDRFTLAALGPISPAASLAEEVRAGLTGMPKRLPCRFFYDDDGSLLFEEICELPEYYVTRAEHEILVAHAAEIVAQLPSAETGTELVELGSGSAVKTRLLIAALLRRQPGLRYVPVDISRSAIEESARALLKAYPALRVDAIAAEYEDGLRYLANQDVLSAPVAGRAAGPAPPEAPPKLLLWLGSNVGNLTRAAAAAFLRGVRARMGRDDRLLIGIDLRKDRAVLEAAYDDARGVTARFNKNLLRRINRELDGRFDLDAFAHRAIYHEEDGRVAMYLVSAYPHEASIEALGLRVPFVTGEAIHTEDSYKYSDAEIRALAAAAGFAVERRWFDTGRRFSENLFRPAVQGELA
ncbi:MAG: hypothetical protein AVDCRST_MAG77-847 [uncultured Chloroflexi bacterium]|uniref:Histidine-specific methyltransferase SAM-dependent domain-containing protein n=1 Tax=uncultured Chloroflexota bacterium TaxID=166587 RepID=A0A6J4HM73_9CHLR|nr:MAG: hypothetical protein AVDCRST_MAG77-847 [uncultured Chloroflexota bacterium]